MVKNNLFTKQIVMNLDLENHNENHNETMRIDFGIGKKHKES